MKQKIMNTEDGMLRRGFKLIPKVDGCSDVGDNVMTIFVTNIDIAKVDSIKTRPKEIVKRKEEWPKEYSELAFDKIIWYHSKQSKFRLEAFCPETLYGSY